MGSESKLVWEPLHRELAKRKWHAQRLEVSSGLGVPDVNLHVPGVGDVWVELKYAEPDGKAIEIGLRPEQYIWLWEGQRAGRSCLLLARVKDGWHRWGDAGAWALAKRRCDWQQLKGTGQSFRNPAEFLDSLMATL